MNSNDYLESIEKLARGYEYEEVQTQIEETVTGTKKKIIKTRKHVPPNFQAAKYLMNKSQPPPPPDNVVKELPEEKVETFNTEKF